MIKNKIDNTLQMPFPPQQTDEYCEGTGQGELNELNQNYSDQFSTILSSMPRCASTSSKKLRTAQTAI